MDEEYQDDIPEEELSPEENPAEEAAPFEDQQDTLAKMQARAAESIEQPIPADQEQTLADMQGRQQPQPVDVPELEIDQPDLGGGPLPDFRTTYVPETADLDLPVPPYRPLPREPPRHMIPGPQESTLREMQARMQRPSGGGNRSWTSGKTKFETKYEPAQQYPADPLFGDDSLTEVGFEGSQLNESGARNREAQAGYLSDLNFILLAHSELIIQAHREIEQLRTAIERYRG